MTDNGPQFIARDFKEFIHIAGLTYVRISPGYPKSNGKIERWHQTLEADCLRPGCPLSIEDCRRLVERFVTRYNTLRLHSAIGYMPRTIDWLAVTWKSSLRGTKSSMQPVKTVN